MQKLTRRRVSMMLLGNLFIGVAVALFRISMLGTDPFTTMNLGVSGVLDMSFGVYQLALNAVLLLIVFLFYKELIGLGTMVNMVGIGFISDFFVYRYLHYVGDLSILGIRIMIMMLAVIIISLGVALYITPELGMAPYDSLAFVIEKVTNHKLPFAYARVMTDITCVVIGFSLGATVGIATIVSTFCTGPFVQYFRKNVAQPILAKESQISASPIPIQKSH